MDNTPNQTSEATEAENLEAYDQWANEGGYTNSYGA